ncbi:MAG TPA: hypothetical protein VK619_14210 [Pyrinomonadaceae bacterium]|nr:hypothetical protein [Pyrinomonadaceae bacterium]
MPLGPKVIQEKIERMLNAWETLAPDKSFAGMTLAQFKAVAAPSQAARQSIADLEDQMTQKMAERDSADEIFNERAQQVINGVLADPTEGPDSALYEAFGYTPKRDRKSGLTRKGKKTQTHTP